MMKILIHLSILLSFTLQSFASDVDPDLNRPVGSLFRVPRLDWSMLDLLSLPQDTTRQTVPEHHRERLHYYNSLLDTNWEYDEALERLALPCVISLSLCDYCEELTGIISTESPNSFTSIGLLEDNTKVMLRSSLDADRDNQYKLTYAMTGALASKLGRAFFERPTIPPCLLSFEQDGSYRVTSYILEGQIDFDGDPEGEELVHKNLHLNPTYFNREEYFTTKLRLFDDFFCFQDRSRAKQFFYPISNIRNPSQLCAFYSGHYELQHYNFSHGMVRLGLKKERFPSLDLLIALNFKSNLPKVIDELLEFETKDSQLRSMIYRTSGQIPIELFLTFCYYIKAFQIRGKLKELFKDLQSKYDPESPYKECEGFIQVFRRYLAAEPSLDIEATCRRLRVINYTGLRLDLAVLYLKNIFVLSDKAVENFFNRLEICIDPVEPQAIIDSSERQLLGSGFDVPYAPLSAILKLEDLAGQFPKLLNQLKQPGYHKALKTHNLFWYEDGLASVTSDGDIFGTRYLYVMNAWHKHFLNHYQGRTFDDKERCWQIYVGSNSLTNCLIINMIEENWPYPQSFIGWK